MGKQRPGEDSQAAGDDECGAEELDLSRSPRAQIANGTPGPLALADRTATRALTHPDREAFHTRPLPHPDWEAFHAGPLPRPDREAE